MIVSLPVDTEEGPSEAICTSEDEICDTLYSTKSRERVAVLFVLKLKHIHKVSQRSLTGLLSDCNSMLESELHSLRTQVMATLDNSTDTTLKGKIGQLFQCHSTKDIFNSLTTEHLQKAFFKEEFHLLVCHQHSTLCCRSICMLYTGVRSGGATGARAPPTFCLCAIAKAIMALCAHEHTECALHHCCIYIFAGAS